MSDEETDSTDISATPNIWAGRDARGVVLRPTKLPALNSAPAGNTPAQTSWMNAIATRMQAHFGTGASLGDRAVLVRDLVNTGLVGIGTTGSGSGGSVGGSTLPLIPTIPTATGPVESIEPPAPINFTADAGLTSVILSWGYPSATAALVGYTEVYVSGTDDFGTKVLLGTTQALVYQDAVGATGIDRYYWIRAIGTGDTPLAGDFFSLTSVHARTGEIGDIDLGSLIIESENIADGAVIASKIADAALTIAKFASGIEPVAIVTSLPSPTGYTGPTVVFNTGDGKLYRYASGAWTAAVSTTDLLGQIASGQLAANSVTAGTIAAGAVTATQIAAGAIRAQNLLITANSLIPDTTFAAGAASWGSGFVDRYQATVTPVPAGCPVQYAARFAYQYNRFAIPVPVNPGDEYRASILVNRSGTSHNAGVDATFVDAAGNYVASAQSLTAASGWTRIVWNFTAPSGSAAMLIGPYIDYTGGSEQCWFADFSIVRMADASLIVDGAVTADKVAANAIVAGKIAADAIGANNILAGSITGDRMQAGTLTAAQIAAGTITGNLIAANTITSTNIASRTIQAVQIAANTITAYEINSKTITADKLTVGAEGQQSNMLKNSDWTEVTGTNSGAAALKNWAWSSTIPGAVVGRNYANGSVWNIGNGGAWLFDNQDYGTGEYNLLQSDVFAVAPYSAYEASVYVAALSCLGYLDIRFVKSDLTDCASGAYSPGASTLSPPNSSSGGSTGVASMIRLWTKGIAPADAAFAHIRIFKYATVAGTTAGNGSYLFANKAFVTNDALNQSSSSNQSPWNDGGLTTIDGRGILTNTIQADSIAADAITAAKISVGTLSDITSNAGIIVSGVLRSADDTNEINLSAINDDDFIRVGNYAIQYDNSFNPIIAIRANGSAYFSREIVSKPKRVAFGTYNVPTAARPFVRFAEVVPPPLYTSTITGAYLTDNAKTQIQLMWQAEGGSEGGGDGGGGGGDGGGD